MKGLGGIPLNEAVIGPHGLQGDRSFSMWKVIPGKEGEDALEVMLAGDYLQFVLFHTRIESKTNGQGVNDAKSEIVIEYNPPLTARGENKEQDPENVLRIPLKPDMSRLESKPINFLGSKTTAYDMGDDIAKWITDRIDAGHEVRMMYIGEGNSRPVLGSLAPHSREALAKLSWPTRLLKSLQPFAVPAERVLFNDAGQYLVVTEESNAHVSSMLDEGCEMDVTKFRPNFVVKGSPGPFVEDFWAELKFDNGVRMDITANCFRCQSITVDYSTGKRAADDRGAVWKKLNKSRRVDKGVKWSPVFGRYGYCSSSSVGKTISIGQKAHVTRLNAERTTIGKCNPCNPSPVVGMGNGPLLLSVDWPGLASFGRDHWKR